MQRHACFLQYVEMRIDQQGAPFSKPETIQIDGENYEGAAEKLRQVVRYGLQPPNYNS